LPPAQAVAGDGVDADLAEHVGDEAFAASRRPRRHPHRRHPGQGREAAAEPGPIGREIVETGPVLAVARVSTAARTRRPAALAQWVPALAPLGRDDGGVSLYRPRRRWPATA